MTTTPDSLTSRIVLALMDEKQRLRPKDLEAEGIPGEYLWLLAQEGRIKKIGRGLYAALDWQASEHQGLIEACRKVPAGVLCLQSALAFHQLAETPAQIWLALPPGTYRPRDLGLKYCQFAAEGFVAGIEVHRLEAAELRVYSLARTVADCFRFRNKIGVELALTALRQALQAGCDEDSILAYARINRVEKVMQPFLLALKA